MLYGATSEALASSNYGTSSASFPALGGTDATIVITFQLPAVPPTGSLSILQLSLSPPYNSSNPASRTFCTIYITAMSVASFGGPGFVPTSGYSNISGYVYAGVSATLIDTVANTTTTVGASRTGLPQFVPKLFGGSWVTVAVSLSSTNNVTTYARDSVLSTITTFGAFTAARAPDRVGMHCANPCTLRRLEADRGPWHFGIVQYDLKCDRARRRCADQFYELRASLADTVRVGVGLSRCATSNARAPLRLA